MTLDPMLLLAETHQRDLRREAARARLVALARCCDPSRLARLRASLRPCSC